MASSVGMDNPSDAPEPVLADAAAASQSMPTPDSQLKRKRQPRNSACQGCAALKMKCIAQPNGRCERCNRMDRDCVPAIPRPRKRRTESSAGVDAEGGSLLDFGASTSALAGPAPKFDPPHSGTSALQPDKVSLLARPDLSHTDSKSFVSLFSQGLGNVTASEELLRGIDYNFVVNSFTIFRQLIRHFPFVELQPGLDVITMVARRPVLTLAICTVASGATADAQGRLSQAFRYALASKVVLGSERSLDVFTGLLVYLAWHHQYRSQSNLYQELYLLAGMAADLGLYRKRAEMADPEHALERDRAFIGCYYLSCCLCATGFDKPSPLRWTDNLRKCAENVATAGRLASDHTLVSLVELVHALDDMEEGLRQDTSPSPSVAIQMVDLQTKATRQRLKALKREHPSLGGTLIFSAATIHVYQRPLRGNDIPDYPLLIQCACAVKEYLDDLLARPPGTLHQICIVDFANLVEILALMARISKPLPAAAGWEAGALTSMLQPDVALESICAHAAATPPDEPRSPRHDALPAQLQAVCDEIRTRILRDPDSARDEVPPPLSASSIPSSVGGAAYSVSGNSFGSGVLESVIWGAR